MQGFLLNFILRIGYAIAQRLAREGAKVVISSRKQNNVDAATQKLKSEGLEVAGVVCHVSKAEDRKNLFETVNMLGYIHMEQLLNSCLLRLIRNSVV